MQLKISTNGLATDGITTNGHVEHAPPRPVVPPAEVTPAPQNAAPPVSKGSVAMPEVSILPDGIKIMAAEDETVLRALTRVGLKYRVGCKRGGCGICKVHLVLGEIRYERPVAESVLSDDERVQGVCLSCRAVPITNIAIQLQDGDRLRKLLGFVSSSSTSTTTNDGTIERKR